MKFIFRSLEKEDIPLLVAAFAQADWPKPPETFATYLQEQQADKRVVWVALDEDRIAGYCTLVWESQYQPFRTDAIPEIVDLNVLPHHRNQYIGSTFLELAEQTARTKSGYSGVGVGLYADYGAAQRLYVKRGYLPDGRGITYQYTFVKPGSMVRVDDELVLWFKKKLNT